MEFVPSQNSLLVNCLAECELVIHVYLVGGVLLVLVDVGDEHALAEHARARVQRVRNRHRTTHRSAEGNAWLRVVRLHR